MNSLTDTPGKRETMEHLHRAGTAMSLAILQDYLVFEVSPKAMKYMFEITMNMIDEADDNILAAGKAYDKMMQGNARIINPVLKKLDIMSLIGIDI